MPYLGAPFVAEGSPEGFLGAIALVLDLHPRRLIHGHSPLTALFTIDAMPGLRDAMGALYTRSLAAARAARPLAEVLHDNFLPESLRAAPAAVQPYLVARDTFVQRLYTEHAGYWQSNGDGIDAFTRVEWAGALDALGGGGDAPFVRTARDLEARGDAALALQIAELGLARHPTSAALRQTRDARADHACARSTRRPTPSASSSTRSWRAGASIPSPSLARPPSSRNRHRNRHRKRHNDEPSSRWRVTCHWRPDISMTDGAHSRGNLGCRNGAATWVGLLFSIASASAARASTTDPMAGRHNHHLRAVSRPAGVPSDYVLTHHGWFHPSCVISVDSDETVGADLVIRGKDGTAHAAFAPCAQARYDRRGRRVAGPAEVGGGATQELAAPIPAPATYDGYIVYYSSSGAITPGSTLVTDWIVPPPPTNVSNQDIAFFNDILTSAGGGDILQPVLDFNGETQGKWSIESEHCCLSGNDMQTTPVVVAPGDLIRGSSPAPAAIPPASARAGR